MSAETLPGYEPLTELDFDWRSTVNKFVFEADSICVDLFDGQSYIVATNRITMDTKRNIIKDVWKFNYTIQAQGIDGSGKRSIKDSITITFNSPEQMFSSFERAKEICLNDMREKALSAFRKKS